LRDTAKCECEGTGFITVAVNGGNGIEYVECGQHQLAFQDASCVDELLAHIGKQTALTVTFLSATN
jgi:hypothetical protein